MFNLSSLPRPVVAYAALGALAAAFLARKRRGRAKAKLGGIVRGAAYGAAVALGAPMVGVRLPELPGLGGGRA